MASENPKPIGLEASPATTRNELVRMLHEIDGRPLPRDGEGNERPDKFKGYLLHPAFTHQGWASLKHHRPVSAKKNPAPEKDLFGVDQAITKAAPVQGGTMVLGLNTDLAEQVADGTLAPWEAMVLQAEITERAPAGDFSKLFNPVKVTTATPLGQPHLRLAAYVLFHTASATAGQGLSPKEICANGHGLIRPHKVDGKKRLRVTLTGAKLREITGQNTAALAINILCDMESMKWLQPTVTFSDGGRFEFAQWELPWLDFFDLRGQIFKRGDETFIKVTDEDRITLWWNAGFVAYSYAMGRRILKGHRGFVPGRIQLLSRATNAWDDEDGVDFTSGPNDPILALRNAYLGEQSPLKAREMLWDALHPDIPMKELLLRATSQPYWALRGLVSSVLEYGATDPARITKISRKTRETEARRTTVNLPVTDHLVAPAFDFGTDTDENEFQTAPQIRGGQDTTNETEFQTAPQIRGGGPSNLGRPNAILGPTPLESGARTLLVRNSNSPVYPPLPPSLFQKTQTTINHSQHNTNTTPSNMGSGESCCVVSCSSLPSEEGSFKGKEKALGLKSIPLPDTEEIEESLKEKKSKGKLPTFEGEQGKDNKTDSTEINPFWQGGDLGAPGVNVVSPDSWDASWFKCATTEAAVYALTDMAGYVLPEAWQVNLALLEKCIDHRLRQMSATPEEVAAAILMAPRQLDKGARRPASLLHDILMGKTQGGDFRDWVRRYWDDARRRRVKTLQLQATTSMQTQDLSPTSTQPSNSITVTRLVPDGPLVPLKVARVVAQSKEAVLAKYPSLSPRWAQIAKHLIAAINAAHSDDVDCVWMEGSSIMHNFDQALLEEYQETGWDGLAQMGFYDARKTEIDGLLRDEQRSRTPQELN